MPPGEPHEPPAPATSARAWLAYHVPRPLAPLRLFCLPHAGGGAALYRHWDPAFAAIAEICAIQLPGREDRLGEPALASLPPLIDRLVDALAGSLTRRYAIFGHSMGGLLAFELARALRRRGLPMPVQLFIASYCAPHLLRREDRARTVRHEAEQQLASAAHIPSGLRGELLELFTPTLEADTRLCEEYEYVVDEPLDCPIAVFRGTADYVLDDHLAGWRAHTRGEFHAQTFLGDHFFVRDTPRGVMQAIHKLLARRATEPAR